MDKFMSVSNATPEEMLQTAIGILKARCRAPDLVKAGMQLHWLIEHKELADNPQMETILYAEMDDYVLYASACTDETLSEMPAGTSKTSWSIHTMPANEALSGGSAADIEQAKRFAGIAYQAAYGIERR